MVLAEVVFQEVGLVIVILGKKMKKFIKYSLIIIISIIGIFYLLFSIYKISVTNNLKQMDSEIRIIWKKHIKNINEKNIKYLSVIANNPIEKNAKDSLLYYVLRKFKNEAKIYKTKDFESYQINEFHINKYSQILSNNMVLKNDLNKESELLSLTNKCKFNIKEFNESVKDYNLYRSIFPNSFLARKLDLENLEFYEINYGEVNENPKEKSDIELWIETGDSKYLDKTK